MPKVDITNRGDIEKLIVHFYEQVKVDEVIGFIFNSVVHMHWETHIPVIVDFWETILLDNPVYKKNAMEIHYGLNKLVPLQKIYFGRWLLLFNTSVDEMFEGTVASLAKTRAKSIAQIMQLKMEEINNNKQPS